MIHLEMKNCCRAIQAMYNELFEFFRTVGAFVKFYVSHSSPGGGGSASYTVCRPPLKRKTKKINQNKLSCGHTRRESAAVLQGRLCRFYLGHQTPILSKRRKAAWTVCRAETGPSFSLLLDHKEKSQPETHLQLPETESAGHEVSLCEKQRNENIHASERPIESVRGHNSAPQRCVGDGGSSKSQRSRSCPRAQGPQGDCDQNSPCLPREAQMIARGGHNQQSAESREISPTSPQARDPATRDPGATTPAGDPAEPRDPDPTRQPPGLVRQTPKILNPLTREPRTLRQTKAPHSTPGVAGGGETKIYIIKRSPRRGEESKAPPDIHSHTQTQSHTPSLMLTHAHTTKDLQKCTPDTHSCSPYTPYSLWSRYCCTWGTTITGSQSSTLSAGVLMSRLPRPTLSTATHHPRPQPGGRISLLASSPRKPSDNRGVLDV
nr:protein piccolo isoform X1 [Nothobranchius furzeri]